MANTPVTVGLDTSILSPSLQYVKEHPLQVTLITTVAVGILSQSILLTGLVFVGTFSFLDRKKILQKLLSDLQWLKYPKSYRSLVQFKLIHLFSVFKSSTYSFQNQLPHLPVPEIEETWEKYLDTVKPLITLKEFSQTKSLIKQFSNQARKNLQTALKEYAKSKDNWLADLWVSYAYLMQPKSLAFSSNWYGIDAILARKFEDNIDRQKVRACHLIRGALAFKELIDKEKIPIIKIRGIVPMCMEQYKRLYACTRIPGKEVDKLKEFPRSKHMVVVIDGHFYKMDVYKNSKPLTQGELWQQLTKIQQLQQKNQNQPSGVNILTSQNRREWYKDRQILMKNEINQKALMTIEQAIALVCLDSYTTNSLGERARNIFLTAQNRWFDKSIQFVVDREGAIGGNIEHSGSDAMIASSMFQHILYLEEEEYGVRKGDEVFLPTPESKDTNITTPVPLEWQLSEELKSKIQKVKKEFGEQAKNYDLEVLYFRSYGKDFIKKQNISPDAYIQMAIQLAYNKLDKEPALTYETVSTRLFLRGRTETIRTVSTESQAFVNAMSDEKKTNHERIQALRSATKRHVAYKIEAMSGRGVDRHLVGLGCMAEQLKIFSPLFQDKSLKLEWKLATSQTPCERSLGGGFSPIVDSGYGISYTVYEDSFIFHITSKKSCKKTDSSKLGKSIRESLYQMCKLFDE